MGYFIRTAMERDLPEISALLEETWHATYDRIYGSEQVRDVTRNWHSVEALRPRLDRPSSEFIVADNGTDRAAVAFAASSDRDRALVILHQLYVRPDAQRAGLGSELLEEILTAFPDGRRIRCEVEAANAAAMSFYRARGFEAVGTAQSAEELGSGVEIVILERPLAP